MRANDGVWIGWPGGTETDLEPFEDDGLSLVPMPLTAEEIEELLRGLLQRHAVADLPRRRRQAGVPPRVVGRLRHGQPAVRRRRPPRSPRRARRSGCTTTSSSWCPQMLRELRPDLRIGFYLHIPFPPAELFAQLPVAAADPRGPARRRPGRLPDGRRRGQLRPAGPAAGRPQDPPRPGLPPRRPHRPGGGVPDLDRHRRLRGAGPHRGGRRARDARSARRSATRARCFLGIDRLDYTKGIIARLRAFSELIEDGELDVEDGGLRPGGDAVAGAGRAVPHPARRHRPAGRPDQRRPRPDRPPRDQLPALRPTPARRWPRSTAPPTSWW